MGARGVVPGFPRNRGSESGLTTALCLSITALLALGSAAPSRPARPNVLYIVVDDLRVELPFYGHRHVHAPNLDELANRSLIFDRAFCNQPVCSPSRNSFLTGRRPSTTQIWNFISDFRAVGPNWTTLPSHFKANGYLTLGTGKLYHEGHPVNGDGNKSWSDINEQFSCINSGGGGAGTYCDPNMMSCKVSGSHNAPNPRWCAIDAPMNPTGNDIYFADINTSRDAVKKLKFASLTRRASQQPFFLGVGIRKPHLDWRIPAGYLDLYPQVEDIPTANHSVAQTARPPVSIHGPWRSSAEENLWKGWGYTNPWTPMTPATAKEMRRFYWAATSFMDSIVGTLLEALRETGFADETLIVFHSDHGWSLGENGDWRKFSLTELGTRVPLLVSVPWLPHTHGQRTSAIAELVDVMPTISDLVGLPNPIVHPGDAPLDGTSLHPLFSKSFTGSTIKQYALSQYPRCPTDKTQLWANNWCINVPVENFSWMGYSLRSNTTRYNAWFQWDGAKKKPIIPDSPVNGSNGFYNELFKYDVGSEDFDMLELKEWGPLEQATVLEMHAELLKLIGMSADNK